MLMSTDLDGDGDLDLIAGNMGENTRLRVSPNYPAQLWALDYDHNGTIDPIVSYYHEKLPYVLVDRDLLASQIPMIKKDYPQYDAYAKAQFSDVFPTDKLFGIRTQETKMTTSIALINRGHQRFDVEVLPAEVQFSSVHIGLALKPNDLLLGGNLFDVQPYLGRQDASPIWHCKRSEAGVWSVEAWPRSGLSKPFELRGWCFWDGAVYY